MIRDLKPYPAYKDSGVPWLGKVPANWEVRRIKTLFREMDERNGDGGGPLLSLTRARGIVPQAEASNRIASVEDLSNYKVCKSGDLIMNRMQAWSGMFAVSGIDGVISPDYSVFQPKAAIDVHYFEALFKTPVLVDEFAKRSKGIGSGFNRLYTPDFGAVPIASPPLNEQTAIVRFLDYMDRRIRHYILTRQKLIKLLEEYKQALIHQAVTGKIDFRTGQPYPAYKGSGVPWLGQVPEHWDVRRIKTIARIRYGLGQPPKDMDGGIPMLRATNINRGTICEKDLLHVDPSDVPSNRGAFLHAGEIIVVRSGAFTADSAIVPEAYDGAVAGYDMVVTALKISPRFLAAVLLTPYVRDDQLTVASMRSAQPHLNAEELGAALVALPPLPEQSAIVEHLDAQTTKIDAAIAAARREIELLREYRTRLIADVVTGKVDVREVAAQLPEEPPEEEAELMDTEEIAEGETTDEESGAEALSEEIEP
ncbi:MAG: restriction endonuclease subunit S [Bacillota bacterium]